MTAEFADGAHRRGAAGCGQTLPVEDGVFREELEPLPCEFIGWAQDWLTGGMDYYIFRAEKSAGGNRISQQCPDD